MKAKPGPYVLTERDQLIIAKALWRYRYLSDNYSQKIARAEAMIDQQKDEGKAEFAHEVLSVITGPKFLLGNVGLWAWWEELIDLALRIDAHKLGQTVNKGDAESLMRRVNPDGAPQYVERFDAKGEPTGYWIPWEGSPDGDETEGW